VVDPQSGQVVLALAGSELPLVVQKTIGQATEAEAVEVTEVPAATEAFGLPLGIEESAVYQPVRLHLQVGDTLLLFTDGLTEARRNGARGEFLDAAGFQDFVRLEYSGRIGDTLNSSAANLGQALLERVQNFAGGTLQDDACLILAQRSSAAFHAGTSAEPLENSTK
jgi:serine phosphatase RsbU (regulator of sigma subunit)